ncbi:hypothetical protein R3W88_013635 [Solanum pinnatisectum]|uniref:Uncharacterized protein n=1 Tax=Solanum pinnatisectum TaxID=50273 RepID=A0AAV9KPH3_9SOLN|nr:hypothetical protein R3W88_013635 [Solanum pinnatisectum]
MRDAQMCPRPNGFEHNLHSKTRWFTGLCNTHILHFATFFIDVRAEISIAESRFHGRGARGGLSILVFLGAFRAGVRWSPDECVVAHTGDGREAHERGLYLCLFPFYKII